MTDTTRITSDLFHSLRGYARLGLDLASTSVSYAGDLLKDVSRHLRQTGERLAPDLSKPTGQESTKA